MSLIEFETQYMIELEEEWPSCRGTFLNWGEFVYHRWMEFSYGS